VACSLCCEFSKILREIVRQLEFGKEYVHHYRSSKENGILRTLIGLMGEVLQCSSVSFFSVSNFQWERSDENGTISQGFFKEMSYHNCDMFVLERKS
jgi:hypothetical protein